MTQTFTPTQTLTASGTYSLIPVGVPYGRDGYQLRVIGTGWTGSLTLVENQAPPGSAANYVSIAYQNANTGLQVAAGTAITANGTFIVPVRGYDVAVQYTHTAGSVLLAVSPASGINADEATGVGVTRSGSGTLERNVRDKLAEQPSVTDYGAVGDGTTDDYAALNRASTTLGAENRLYFPPGTYRVGTNLTVNCEAIFALGATLEPDAGVTVTLAGPLTTAPGASIIATGAAGTVSITGAVNGSGVLDVRTFGAVGDGVTDDTAAVQRALNAGQRVSFGGPPNVYAVTNTITIPSSRTLEGAQATVRRKAGSGAFDIFQNSDQVGGNQDISIVGLIVDGNAAADGLDPTVPADRFSGISFVGVTGNSRVEYCTVTGTVNNETGGGIYVVDCEDVSIADNEVYDNDRSGIVYFNGARNKFIRNVAYSNGGSGIVGGGCADALFAFNTTHTNGSAGVHTGLNASCPRARVMANLSYGNTGSGIAIGEAVYTSDNAVAQGNECRDNTLDGISVQYSDRVQLIGNKLNGNARHNIRLFNGADECVVVGNVAIGSTGGQGIYVDDGVRHIIASNLCKSNAGSGIVIDSTATDGICCDNVCVNNDIAGAGASGILLTSTTNWNVSNNRCYDTAGAGGTQDYGITISAGSGSILSGNIVYTNAVSGIRELSSPQYSGRYNKIGSDDTDGTFTPTAGLATYTVTNNNARAIGRIKVWPMNAAANVLQVYVSGVGIGATFNVATGAGNFVGTELYGYELE